MAENPLNATYIGDPRFNAQWPDLSPAAQARAVQAKQEALAEPELPKLLGKLPRRPYDQAIDYFRANAAKTEVDIVNEVDRYIGWSGQALPYKLTRSACWRCARAEAAEAALAALADHFDLLAYHDMPLDGGALPLDLLDSKVNTWIGARLKQST